MKVKFYYSSKDKPGEQYPNNNAACVEKIKTLKSRGADAEAVDVANVEDVFRLYHAALTGPPATVRAVFGMKGGLEADFGRATPAVLVWGDPNDRYPTDAYPRQDQARGGLVGCEKALDDLTKELAKMPTTEDEEDQPVAR
ncbi:MAG TPA: hypothetical protein VGK86_10300 [Thermoanaerobaculia bacterium]|jgi:hypothetical protein